MSPSGNGRSSSPLGDDIDGPMAWSAHRERQRVLKEALGAQALKVPEWGVAMDQERPHELAEFVVQIVSEPTIQAVMIGASAYVGNVIAKQVDKLEGSRFAPPF